MEEQKIVELCNKYCGNNMKELKRICAAIFAKSGSIPPQSEYDEYISLANITVLYAAKNFDETQNDNFEGWLVSCIKKRFRSEMRNSMRQKRCACITYEDPNTGEERKQRIYNVSIDSTLNNSNDEDGRQLSEMIGSGYVLEDEVIEDEEKNEKLERFFNSLRGKSRKILRKVAEGNSKEEIMEDLGITAREYTDAINEAKSFKSACILLGNN